MASNSGTGVLITAAAAVAGTITVGWFVLKNNKKSPAGDENRCLTKNRKNINYTWTISNFSFYGEKIGEVLESSTFSDTWPNDKEKWSFQLYPNGKDQLTNGYISLYLCLKETQKSPIKVKLKLSILNAKKRETNVREIKHCQSFIQGTRYGWHTFVSRSFLFNKSNGLLPDDNLTIFCQVTVVGDTVNESGQGQITQFRLPENRLSKDLSHLFDNSSYADCMFIVGGIQIKAHKAILSARSEVFEAMFRHDGTTESLSSVVNITDIEYNVMTELVRYIYTGEAPNLQTIADELLLAADKYGFIDLKMACEQALVTNLTVENACQILVIADLTNAEQLKRYAICFIKDNTVEVMGTSGWKIMEKEHVRLVVEMFKIFAGQ